MRTALMLLLVVPGMLLLGSPWVPVGVAMMLAGWWVYERAPRIVTDEGFVRWLMVAGGAGALVAIIAGGTGWIRAVL